MTLLRVVDLRARAYRSMIVQRIRSGLVPFYVTFEELELYEFDIINKMGF